MIEPPQGEVVPRSAKRYTLELGKYRVIERTAGSMKIALGGSTTMTVLLPENAGIDVRTGDILTLYTQVLYANPQQTPVQ